jgi:tetratricopeptide (TPR) repeat protein
MIYTVPIGEPFKLALDNNQPAVVADSACQSPHDFYARGVARAAIGRFDDARADLVSACRDGGSLESACKLELAFFDIRTPGAVASVAEAARQIADTSPRDSKLAARAHHIAGLADCKADNGERAVEQLLEAARIYQEIGCEDGRAQVLDTLGMVQAARGRLDDAMHHYALSLAAKTTLNDMAGIAISLGNMGRVQLQAGRYERAIECFRADLQIAQSLEDRRGIARSWNDVGRAWLGLGDYTAAREALRQSGQEARRHGYRDIEFFAKKDMVLVDVADRQLDAAGELLAEARDLLPSDAEAYFRAHVAFAEGVWLAAKENPLAVARLRSAVENFGRLSLADEEVAARIELARSLLARKETREAERCLLRGIESARARGLLRFLPLLNEIMTGLDIVEGAIEENQRTLGHDAALGERGYVIRAHLGAGAFGDVFRVYDPEHTREGALKLLRLAAVYDPQQRQRLIDSARTELQATAHVRHPGIARVFAIGTLADGREYVLQEFISGPSLRHVMKRQEEEKQPSDVREVLNCVSEMAYALAALHGAGVIHRDLKPENVVLRDNRHAVLLDFGIAYLSERGKQADSRVVGTLPYMSPEQLLGRAIDNRSDLYSLGVIAYEWLTGRRPLTAQGDNLVEQVRDLATRVPSPPAKSGRALPDEAASLVMQLLEKSPKRRPENALQVARRASWLVSTLS